MLSKLILGTANFGTSYGIANKKKLPDRQILGILKIAEKNNIWGIDTASAYGDSEKIIGKHMTHSSMQVITKLPNKRYLNEEDVIKEVKNSLKDLNIKKIDILLIHSFNNYKKDKDVILQGIKTLISKHLIKHWGVSVYYVDEVKNVLKDGYRNFVVEFPVNLFDRRFLLSGFLKELKDKECFLIARSVFLQGLFVLNIEYLKGNIIKCSNQIQNLQKISNTYEMPIPILALLFVLTQKYIDKVIIGVDSVEQLIINISAPKYLNRYRKIADKLGHLQVNNENILLPFRWKLSN